MAERYNPDTGEWETVPDEPTGGDGVNGVFREINGRLLLVNPRTGAVIQDYGPVQQEQPAPDRNLGSGVYQDDRGFYVYTNPQRDSGLGVTTSGTKRYITEYEADRIMRGAGGGGMTPSESTAAGNLSARYAELELDRQRLQQQIEEANRDYALSQQEYDFKVAQQAWAESEGQKERAAQAARDAQQAWYQGQQIGLQIGDMRTQLAITNARMQQETAQFNAQMGFNVQQANQQAREQKAARLQALSSDISEASKDPGDRAKLASYVLANTGWGQDTGVGQQDFVTDESLTGLEGLLRTRQDVQNQSDNPYSFSPLTAQQIDLSFLDKLGGGQPGTMQTGSPGPINVETAGSPKLMGAGGIADTDQRVGEFVTDESGKTTWKGPDIQWERARAGLPQLEHGGMVQGAFIAGDSSDGKENEEMIMPLGDGMTLIVPMKGKRKPKGMEHFQDGGLFGNLDMNRDLSRSFLSETNRRARAGTPFEDELFSPVWASSPGTNPIVRDLLNALNASQRGIPVAFSEYQQQRYAPAGINERVVGRTA